MELFAARGANINLRNALGETALMHAAWKGRIDAVRWLLQRGARADDQRGKLAWTALHYAVFAGHDEIAELLLERGADINARSPNGSSVLMMAVYEGRENTARWLLAHGADTKIRNENGLGALDWAMKFNHLDIARIVSTHEEFLAAANRPKSDWGNAQKSAPIPKDLEDLLNQREILASRNMSLEKIDRRIAAMRAKYARESLKKEAPPAATLEITAERKMPAMQRSRVIYAPTRQRITQ
jgi:ankyrin repeat protein